LYWAIASSLALALGSVLALDESAGLAAADFAGAFEDTLAGVLAHIVADMDKDRTIPVINTVLNLATEFLPSLKSPDRSRAPVGHPNIPQESITK
jgi:hypothetical protein